MAASWYPLAIRNPAPTDGGSHLGPPEKGVLHTTEGEFTPRDRDYFGHKNYPHFTCDVDVVNGRRTFLPYQHISIRRAARALANRSGGVQTNREGCIQLEIVGKAANPFTDDPVMVDGLRRLMRWIEENTEIPRTATATFWEGRYGLDVPHRMSGAQWERYKGWCGHQHVPENTHYDPGAIDIALLLGTVPTALEEDEMFLFRDSRDGAVYLRDGGDTIHLSGPGSQRFRDKGVLDVGDLPGWDCDRLKEAAKQ